MKIKGVIINNKEIAKRYNILAREQLKLKILVDLNMDLHICKIEGWDHKEYIVELREMLKDLILKS